MALNETAAAEIEFIGPPHRMIAVGLIPDLEPSEVRIEGKVADCLDTRRAPLRARRARGHQQLKLRLRPDTPPGDYLATLHAGERSWSALVRVLPHPRVQMVPAELSFSGAPGARATCLAVLLNEGNVAIELPKVVPVGIFDDDGVESAFAATYARGAETFDDFFGTFHGRLREAHGGLLKLRLVRGAGKLAPCSSVALEVTAELPEALTRGHRYHGVWSTDFSTIAVSVTARK